MVTKKKTQSLKKSDCEQALQMATSLLKKLKSKTDWTEEDEEKLQKLNKIVMILSKLIPLEKKGTKAAAKFSSAEDEKIIQHFLARRKIENN